MSQAVLFLCPNCKSARALAAHPGPDKVRCLACKKRYRTDGCLHDATGWRRIKDPDAAIRVAAALGAPLSERKQRLLAVAAGRSVFDWCRNPWFRDALQSAEQWADEGAPPRGVDLCRRHLAQLEPRSILDYEFPTEPWYADPDEIAHLRQEREQFAWVALAQRCVADEPQIRRSELSDQTRPLVAGLVRELVPNPFRPPEWNSDWLTSTVRAMAAQAYTTREFSGLPILADALQDAGCDDHDILSHCRTPGAHHRGCWVLDAILGQS